MAQQRFTAAKVLRGIIYLLFNGILIFACWAGGAYVGILMDPDGESLAIIFTAFAGMMVGVWLSTMTYPIFYDQ